MDTFTHLALGACLGELLATKRIGKKALLAGALAQSVPDIDFIFSFWLTPSANLLAHRGFTHSFLFAFLIAPVLAWFAQQGWGSTKTTFWFWLTFFLIQVLLHSMLDAFNAYGTGWFEPFSQIRISFHTLFVADPFFSISLGVAALALIFLSTKSKWRIHWALAGILLSATYLTYAGFNKLRIESTVKKELANQRINSTHHFTTPTPFNSWLWYVVVNTDSGSYVGYRSVFDTQKNLDVHFFPRRDSLLMLTDRKLEVDRLLRFSQGYYSMERKGDTLVFNDLRFGQMVGWQKPEAGFVFHYYLKPDLDNHLVLQRGRFHGWNQQSIKVFARRIRGN